MEQNKPLSYESVPFSREDFDRLVRVCADARLGLYKQAGYDGRVLMTSFSDYFRNACFKVAMPFYSGETIAVMKDGQILGSLLYDIKNETLQVSRGGIFDARRTLRSITGAIVDHVCLSDNVGKFRELTCGACEQVPCLVDENGLMRHFFFPSERYDIFHVLQDQFGTFSAHEPQEYETVLAQMRGRYSDVLQDKGILPGYEPMREEMMYFTGKELLRPEKAMLRRDMLFLQVFDNAVDPCVTMDVMRVAMAGLSAALDCAALAGEPLQDVPSLRDAGRICYESASWLDIVPDGPISVLVGGMLPGSAEVRVNPQGQPEFVFRGEVQATGAREVVSRVSSLILSEDNIRKARQDVSLFVQKKLEAGLRRSIG